VEKAEKFIVDTEKVLVDAEKAADAAKDAEQAVSKVAHGAEEAKGAESGASCALHSFVAGTRVLLADGSTKPIEQVANGDVVETTDPSTGAVEQHKVVGTLVHSDEEQRTEVVLDSGGSLVATDWHPVWVEETGTWTPIGSLTEGEHLHSADGRSVLVTAVRHFEQQAPVYDLTVDSVHDYYVGAGAVSVLVHNCPAAGGGAAEEPMVRMRHYTNAKGKNGIVQGNVIKASDQNKVFMVPAKGKPMSPRDAESTLGIGRGRGRHVVEFDAPASRVDSRFNSTMNITEWIAEGDLPVTNIRVIR
jgi:hypothetical protein